MTPRLLLLTGPAAGDVAAVFRKGMHTARLGWNFPYWDEVRDYWKALKIIELAARGLSEGFRPQSTYHDTAKAIHSLPGGEEWLVGLVLPECPSHMARWGFRKRLEGCIGPTESPVSPWPHGPARLAILAPGRSEEEERKCGREIPPELLAERVRAWGGEVWRCAYHSPDGTKPCHIVIVVPGKDGRGGGGRDFWEDTWPEAVRAALGES